VGQKFASMGSKDIRKDAFGKIDFRVSRMLRSWKLVDAPPTRVKPVPVTIILYILARAFNQARVEGNMAIADMIAIAFFFLLRPGEYTGTTSDDAPFRLRDIQFYRGSQLVSAATGDLEDIRQATAVALVFTTQKNGNRNEKIVHGRSGHPLCCPVKAVIRRVLHLRQKKAKSDAPLASYYNTRHRRVAIQAKDVTDVLRLAAGSLRRETGLSPEEISARSIRAGGAMALLCGKIDHDTIKLLGRWHSDAMMRYLHVQAEPIMRNFAKTMFNNGTYTFLPDETVPLAPE
jgi:hypothetical protein